MYEVTNEIRSKVKEYHNFHGDENIRIVSMIPDELGEMNGILVRIGDDVSIVDEYWMDGGGCIYEVDYDKRENEEKMIDRYAGKGEKQ